MEPMSHLEFLALARQFRQNQGERLVDRVEVNSKRELVALSEWADRRTTDPAQTITASWSGVPVLINEEIPEGILRFKKGDEVVGEVAVR